MPKINVGTILKAIVKVASLIITAKQAADIVIPAFQKKVDKNKERK